MVTSLIIHLDLDRPPSVDHIGGRVYILLYRPVPRPQCRSIFVMELTTLYIHPYIHVLNGKAANRAGENHDRSRPGLTWPARLACWTGLLDWSRQYSVGGLLTYTDKMSVVIAEKHKANLRYYELVPGRLNRDTRNSSTYCNRRGRVYITPTINSE